jgi:UDP-N-acetylmuramoyl-L-alanyl-D-glutamate--2,6-diaminopimelate ligase
MYLPTQFPVACHTDNIGPGSTFVAVKGMQKDGVDFIPAALRNGAGKIVIEQETVLNTALLRLLEQHNACLVRVSNTRRALAELSAAALNFPAKKLKLIGITGTKGKTTTTYILEHILRNAGFKTARISTVKNSICGIELHTNLTTPHPDYLHIFFDACVKKNVEFVVMEVAAQAISLERVHGLEFDGLVFTNFSQEHGEFYPTIEHYFASKMKLFDQIKISAPILINGDDVSLCAINKKKTTFGFANDVAIAAQLIEAQKAITITIDGTLLSCSNLCGNFNAYNLLAAGAMANQVGVDWNAIANAIASFSYVPGRFEGYKLPNGARCFIDYAHNPSSFEALFSTVRSMTNHLIVVFGAGGDRDKTKRPVMGNIAAQWADVIILTADNPRSEDPQDIINQIIAGIEQSQQKKVMCELDRKKAIELAYQHTKPSSIILLLGKGPDEYQLIGGQKFYFSEREIIQSL